MVGTIKLRLFKFFKEYTKLFNGYIFVKVSDLSRIITSLFWREDDCNMQAYKEVKGEHLLRRKILEDLQRILDDDFSEDVILVTGAAGFVGRELCRQLASYPVKKLLLLDQLDSALFDTEQELMVINPYLETESILGDIKECTSLEHIFINEQPSLVFHTAAYKDIQLLEANPFQAVGNNILGTMYLADLSIIYKVDKFVFVSTDQAFNPDNVMGASKRVAEKYLENLEESKSSLDSTKFIITRFENIQSNSLPNKFKPYNEKDFCNDSDCIKISHSCKLIIDSCKMGKGGEIFTFDSLNGEYSFESSEQNVVKYSGLSHNELLPVENVAKMNIVPTFHPYINLALSEKIDRFVFSQEFEILYNIWENQTDDYELIRQLFILSFRK